MTSLTGTPRLVRLALRRDRIRLSVWLLALTVSTVAVAFSLSNLYADPVNRQEIAATMNSPAGLAMSGPERYLEDYHFGAIMGHQMLAFTGLLAAIMSVLIVVRHTRSEEESGRAELVRASVVGRHAHLTGALIVAVGANLVLAVLLAVGMGPLGLEGITWSGSVLYGLAHASVGIVFAGVAALTVQISEHPRGAAGMGFAAVGAAYLLRAMGDAGGGELSWLSPLGWAQYTYVYLDNRWWPLSIALGTTAVVTWSAFALSTRRDVGAGLRSPRPGTGAASRSLLRPTGFALRLHRGLLAGFIAGLALLGVGYGSVIADAEGMLSGIEMIEEALADLGGATVVESFASLILMVMAVMASVYVVLASFKPRSEEDSGRAEPVLATGLSQERWVGSHLVVAMIGSAAVMGAAGLGFGATAAAVTGDAEMIGDLLGASLAYVPALWVTGGVAVLLYGVAPRAASLAWLVPVYGFLVGYLGQILQFPDWMMNLSPFGHVPQLPAQPMRWAPVALLTALALVLLATGVLGFRRRDLRSTA